MRNVFLPLIKIFAFTFLHAQTYPNLQYSETGNINLFYSDKTDDDAQFIGLLTNAANIFYASIFGDLQVDVNLLVINHNDWKKHAIQGSIFVMPHFKASENAIIVAAEDNDFWKSQLPDISNLKSPYKELFSQSYTMQNGTLSARNFFDLLAIHELAHVWSKKGKRTIQRLWLEEVFCNLAMHTYIAEERGEWLSALEVLPSYHALTQGAKMKYTKLVQFEADYNTIAMNAPHNYGWYQFKFHHAARHLYNEGGAEVIKKLWHFLGKYQEKLSDAELHEKLAMEVHPYFKTLLDEW